MTTDALTKLAGPALSRVDPANVESAAALGMTMPDIADGLGISERSLHRAKSGSVDILAAYKRGRYRFKMSALEELNEHAKKQVIASIFKVKHAMGWHDGGGAASQVPQAIKVEISIGQAGATAVIAPGEATEPLEAEYKEVEE